MQIAYNRIMAKIEQTLELEQSICSALSQGKSLVSWCKENKISYNVVTGWLLSDANFATKYASAREAQIDHLAEEIIDISDNKDILPEHKRVMVDSRKWYAGKLNAKKYGDKQQVELTGKDGEPLSLRLIEAQQRLLKDVTPRNFIEHNPTTIAPDDII